LWTIEISKSHSHEVVFVVVSCNNSTNTSWNFVILYKNSLPSLNNTATKGNKWSKEKWRNTCKKRLWSKMKIHCILYTVRVTDFCCNKVCRCLWNQKSLLEQHVSMMPEKMKAHNDFGQGNNFQGSLKLLAENLWGSQYMGQPN